MESVKSPTGEREGYSAFRKVQSAQQEEEERRRQAEDINEVFLHDTSLFIGEFRSEDKHYRIQKGYIAGKGEQIRLYFTKFIPPAEPTCSVGLVHSFGEYSGRHLHVAEALVLQGYEVNMLDLRGFGFSGGPRASSTITELHQDIESLIQQSARHVPLFLIGFSMGGMLVISFLMNNPQLKVAGAVLVNPLIQVPEQSQLSGHKGAVVKLVGKEFKDIVINSMMNLSALTKDSYETMKIFKDHLIIPFMSFAFVKHLLECSEWVQQHCGLYSFPLLLALGEQDGILDHRHAKALFHRLPGPDKQLVLFPQGYHELHNDVEFPSLMAQVHAFIQQRLPQSKALGNQLGKVTYGYRTRSLGLRASLLLGAALLLFLWKVWRRGGVAKMVMGRQLARLLSK